MKHSVFPAFLFMQLTAAAQSKHPKLIGQYRDNFGSAIEIKADSTFHYSWAFDLSASWSQGTWSIKNDTIYFKMIPVYDTLRYKNNVGKTVDSLVLAGDEHPKLITRMDNAIDMLSSGGQNRSQYPAKLFFRNERLYEIDQNGKLIKQKLRGFWSNTKWVPWYFKQVANK
jgi:hypothetical protein